MINDDTLTLFYFDDGLSPDERRQVASAIRNEPGLAARYAALKAQLDSVRDSAPVTVPAHVLQQLHDTVTRAATLETQAAPGKKSSLHLISFIWGAGVTAILVLGITAGLYLGGNDDLELIVPRIETATTTVPTAFTRGLQAYFQDSQYELAKLSTETNGDRAALLMQIINQNRMFERAAVQNNAQNVARVLRAFEPILLRLASDDIAPADAEALKAQLSFELSVMLTKLAQASSEEPQSI